ncbi:GNAT family N-acetyltransferase [Streptomyces noursei]|uniref:GNAT family N-acetyltransferase n=1 Tax=Streptomyces noursei TaxID=1971 RepID=UPI001678A73F|nr:GNAT family N-acetyltransferase [Streptomyces noursei]MCZ1015912.1 GNAT family N-acetyltransferase [Streptomyces noursei]GGW91654.1 N-acetyltransferase GCN5 [Streptomyces noursei]
MTTERKTQAPHTARQAAPRVRIEPWTDGGLDLLRRANAPEMTRHLGGPETEEQVARRHRRYLAGEGPGRMYRVLLLPEGEAVGTVGFWEPQWRGEAVYEAGWGVLPGFQGRGIAVAAVRQVLVEAAAEGRHRTVHAFPSVANAASNAVCRKAGFTLRGECDVEYPKGHFIQANEWRTALPEGAGGATAR